MNISNLNDQGVVIKKVISKYHVYADGHTFQCGLSTQLYKDQSSDIITVGDRVGFTTVDRYNGTILAVLPRRNKFSRPAPKNGNRSFEQVIASNVDQIVPVFSVASPIPRWGLLDRYLVAAEAAGLPVLVCISKSDLAPSNPDLREKLVIYRAIGYPVLMVSALTGEGLPELVEALQGRVSVLVGKSGVGKSSLLNALQPGLNLLVRPVTRGVKGKGRHTTTHLEMYPLHTGGSIIDTPGIREFGLWDIYAEELADCFPEMAPLVGRCRFGLDCRHDEEPGCAIRRAVMAGKISPLRYKSYMRLLEELP
ncbi:MAG: ribosome small subunit-dependent GTPase A [Anaerolineales bacterium]